MIPRAATMRVRKARSTLMWADEFIGPAGALPNSAYWFNEEGLVRNSEAQYYTVNRAANCRLSGNSTLIIDAIKEDYLGSSYTSASLRSQGLKQFLYGRIEVRAKLPTGNGTWPAIWAMGINGAWPARGEIDIMEHVGYEANTIHSNVITTNFQAGQYFTSTGSVDVTAWHVYWMEWSPTQILIGYDSTLVNTFPNLGGSSNWPFDAEIYMLLNLAIGGSWGGAFGINDSLFPHRMEVDYVRQYKIDP